MKKCFLMWNSPSPVYPRDRLLAGGAPTGLGPFWLVTVARYRDGRPGVARAYSEWFARGLPSLRAVGGRWIASGDLCSGGGSVVIVELPSPAALQEMQAKYEFVKRGASPAAVSDTFCLGVNVGAGARREDAVADVAMRVEVVEQSMDSMFRLSEGEDSVMDNNASSENVVQSLKLVLPCSSHTIDNIAARGYAEIADSMNPGVILNGQQMHLGKL